MTNPPPQDALSAAMSSRPTPARSRLRRNLWRIFWTLLVVNIVLFTLIALWFSGLADYHLP